MYRCAVIRKYGNYNGDCACADGFPVLVAESLEVAILWTSVSKGVQLFEGVEVNNCSPNSCFVVL